MEQIDNDINAKILFLAGLLSPGGAERQLFYNIKTLKSMGYDVSVITLSKDQYWESVIRELNIPVYFAGKSHNRLLRLISIIFTTLKIKPNIIQSQHFYTNFYAAIAGRLLGVRNIGALRSDGVSEVKIVGLVFGNLCLYTPKYLAANSLAGVNFAKKSGIKSQRIRFLPNVIDTTTFTPSAKKGSDRVTLLLVSNLENPLKRVELFIQVIKQVRERVSTPISALIAGDGQFKSDLQQLAKDYGLFPGIISFLGTVDHMERIYQQADIHVLTSDREGTPNAIMEAMSSGLPVVATSVGGVPDLVQHGSTGFLVRPGDVNDLVNQLSSLIENKELRNKMGSSGREYILAHYSLERLPAILEEFYTSIQ